MKHVAPFHQVVRREEPVEVSRGRWKAEKRPVYCLPWDEPSGVIPVCQESSAPHSGGF